MYSRRQAALPRGTGLWAAAAFLGPPWEVRSFWPLVAPRTVGGFHAGSLQGRSHSPQSSPTGLWAALTPVTSGQSPGKGTGLQRQLYGRAGLLSLEGFI